jgi:sugar-specific transcriptional regulator TrmB
LDESTFKQLKQSNGRHPEITEVIFEPEMMSELGLVALNNIEKAFDIVWDKTMLDFIWNFFRGGLNLAEKMARERKVKFRLIVEVTKENKELIKALKNHEIRHVDNIRSNFAIFDERAYMVQIFQKEDEPPSQAYFSNSKSLVISQQVLFDRLWKIGMPLESRLKEIEYQDKLNYSKILSNQDEIYNEIDSMIDQTRKELLIFSSSSLLSKVANQSSFLDNYRKISDKKVALRILVDSADENVLDKFKHINNKSDSAYLIDVGFTEKLGKFNEMLMISDSRYVIQTRYNGNNDKLIASFSNEEHQVLVQEIIFEKYWNEVKGLSNNISTV